MRTLDIGALRDFEHFIRAKIPGFEVRFKSDSKLMAILGFLAAPFNPEFLSRYTTTWGKRVYFPTRDFYWEDPAKSFRILAHEFVHLVDSQRQSLFKVSYSFPQILTIVPLIVYLVLVWPYSWIALLPFAGYLIGCVAAKLSRILFWVVFPLFLGVTGTLAWYFTSWWAFVLLGVVVFLAPWPAYWRTKWEIRGYGMNVAVTWWLYQVFSSRHVDSIVRQFTGPDYFYMCWSGAKIRSAMRDFHVLAQSSELGAEDPYKLVHAFLCERIL